MHIIVYKIYNQNGRKDIQKKDYRRDSKIS